MFTNTYELSLNRNYVSHWGMAQAVRELIQNALDSESPFVYEFRREGDSHSLALTSEFTVLTPQTLLLGSTSKRDSTDTIGSFGEGYKIALLVLTRLGYDIEMHNSSLLWKPRFRHSKKFGEELLVIDETSLSAKNKGLTFYVNGLSEEDVEQVRASCLQMQDNIGEVKLTPKGGILIDRPGKLYVGGLYVCDTELTYGYNIKPEFLKLERDRQTVDSWDLKGVTKDMWFATEEYARIGEMISKELPDVAYARYSSTDLVREACYQHFKEQHPGAVMASSDKELKELVKTGMKVYVGGGAYYSNVTSSRGYQTELKPKVKTPAEYMQEWYDKHRFHMHEKCRGPFLELISQSKNWRADT